MACPSIRMLKCPPGKLYHRVPCATSTGGLARTSCPCADDPCAQGRADMDAMTPDPRSPSDSPSVQRAAREGRGSREATSVAGRGAKAGRIPHDRRCSVYVDYARADDSCRFNRLCAQPGALLPPGAARPSSSRTRRPHELAKMEAARTWSSRSTRESAPPSRVPSGSLDGAEVRPACSHRGVSPASSARSLEVEVSEVLGLERLRQRRLAALPGSEECRDGRAAEPSNRPKLSRGAHA